MRVHFAPLVLLCVAIAAAACAPAGQGEPAAEQPASTEADQQAINAMMDRWEDGLNNTDIDGLLSLFTDNTVAMPPDEPAVTGEEAIRSWYETFFAQGPMEFDLQTVELKVGGDWASGRGTYRLTVTPEGGEPVTVAGKWVVLYERQPDGSWRAASFIWNSDSPPPVEGV